jgi:hypothetical protein
MYILILFVWAQGILLKFCSTSVVIFCNCFCSHTSYMKSVKISLWFHFFATKESSEHFATFEPAKILKMTHLGVSVTAPMFKSCWEIYAGIKKKELILEILNKICHIVVCVCVCVCFVYMRACGGGWHMGTRTCVCMPQFLVKMEKLIRFST